MPRRIRIDVTISIDQSHSTTESYYLKTERLGHEKLKPGEEDKLRKKLIKWKAISKHIIGVEVHAMLQGGLEIETALTERIKADIPEPRYSRPRNRHRPG